MEWNNLVGAGRSPQVNGAIKIYDTGTVNEDISIGSDETNTVTLSSPERVIGVFVSIYRNTSGGVPSGSAVGAKFNAFIDEKPIGFYALPSSNEWATGITDFIPVNVELWGNGHSLKVVTGAASGVSYNIFYRVVVYTMPM